MELQDNKLNVKGDNMEMESKKIITIELSHSEARKILIYIAELKRICDSNVDDDENHRCKTAVAERFIDRLYELSKK